MSRIGADHLAREAIVYVRQSTVDQVNTNVESRRRQYGLVERARQLGWADVSVIDDDLGRSGSGVSRPGFEIRPAPRLSLTRLRDLRAHLDAVLGSNQGDSPPTDGADHAHQSPTTGSVRRAAAPATDPERTPPGDGGEFASASGGGAFAEGLGFDPEGGAP